jgi:hypothetical protein
MSLWGKIKKGVKKAAKAVSNAVHTATNAVGEAVGDVVETIGNGIQDGIAKVGSWAENIPGVGGAIGAVLRWAGRIVSNVTDLVGAVVKGITGIVGGIVGGVVLILGGIISLDGGLIVEGFEDIISGIAGGILVILGKAVSLVQTIFVLERERALTERERALLKRVFRESVALYNVRIVDGFAGIYSVNPRPFTLGNTIYLKDHDSVSEPETLVHECTHVWQYQHWGSQYASDAVGAQWFVPDEYSWERELQRGNLEWADFNKEAEGRFLEDIFTDGELLTGGGVSGPGGGVFYDAEGKKSVGRFVFNTVDRTNLADESVAYVRDAHTARLSGAWS